MAVVTTAAPFTFKAGSPIATFSGEGSTLAPPANSFTRVADRALLLDAEGIVGVELSPDGLEPSWRCARPSPSRHQLAISDGSLYVRSGGGDAYVLQGYDLP